MRSGLSRLSFTALVFLLGSTAALAISAPAGASNRSYYSCHTAQLTNGGRTVNAKTCTGTGDLTGPTTLVISGPDAETYSCTSGQFTTPAVYPPNITGLNCLSGA